jgi:ribosome-binding protein aMBF1 (putative translation factor)
MNTVTIKKRKFVLVPMDEYKELKSRPKMLDFPSPDSKGNFDAVAFTRASISRGIVKDREKVGLSQRDLADAAGIRVEILNRAERGVTIPSVRTLTKIETALRKAGLKRRIFAK